MTLANGDGSTFVAYLAQPTVPLTGAVVLIHEIWGLVDHITDIADRLAAEGYLVVAPDLLSRVGIVAHVGLELQEIMFSPDPTVRTEGQPRLRDALAPLQSPAFGLSALESLKKCVDYLADVPEVAGRIAVMGFCFGGSYSFMLAAGDPRIRAAVPFYGQGPGDDAVAETQGKILAFYGATDAALAEKLPALTASMATAGVDFTPVTYEGSGHAFFNDTNPITYQADAAADAWAKSLEFLGRTLA
ncbi:MAG: dienelactone hydrolase family protein [Burkholderiaceae bacterium]|nr:dienelactone hydrolase family protein [Microbacteriaceae bacterium]